MPTRNDPRFVMDAILEVSRKQKAETDKAIDAIKIRHKSADIVSAAFERQADSPSPSQIAAMFKPLGGSRISEEPSMFYNIGLRTAEIDIARRLGDGNISAGVRAALEKAK